MGFQEIAETEFDSDECSADAFMCFYGLSRNTFSQSLSITVHSICCNANKVLLTVLDLPLPEHCMSYKSTDIVDFTQLCFCVYN